MATPTAICPVCFVRFPVSERSSTPTSCPACASKFAAPVHEDDDEPKPAAKSKAKPRPKFDEKVKPAKAAPAAQRVPEPEDHEYEDDDFDDEPKPKKKPKKARAGFRLKDDEDADDREPEESVWSNPLVLAGVIGGGLAVLAAAIVLLVYGLSPANPDGDLANLPPAPKPAPIPQPQPQPAPQPPQNPWGNQNPDPFRPPVGPDPDPFDPPFNPQPVPQPPLFPNVPNPPVFPPKPPEKPKEKMKLPAPTPVAMKAAPLTEDSTEVKLPGTVKDACVGGGGRYFCLYLADKKQIAVFDVCEAKVVKYLPVAGAGALLAANMNKLLVVFPDESLVVRYDLATLEKEATLKLPFDGKPKAVAMGSASAGPLLIQHQIGNDALGSAPVSYLDPIKLTEFDLPTGAGGRGHASIRDAMHFRASPDGTVFGVWATSHSPTGLGSTVLADGEAKHHYEHDSVGSVVPGPDGTLYTGSGRYTPNLKKKGDGRGRGFGLTLPAASGGLYFTLGPDGKTDDPFGGFPPPGIGREPGKMKADIKMDGDERSLVTLKDVPGAASDAWAGHDFTADKRYLLVPDAKAFVALAGTNDKLIVRKFDLLGAMEAAGIDYLFVASRPGGVKPGAPFDYQIDVKSKKGGVAFNLDSGPDGLKVSPAGRVTWAVPKDYTGGQSVIITVSDKSGQQVFHTFELKEGPPAATALPPIDGPRVPPINPPLPPDPKPPVAVVPQPKVNPDQVVVPPAKPFPQPRTKLTAKAAVALPEAADAMCLGGGGRFVLYRLPKAKQLAILDLSEGKVVKYLPLAEANATFAAGMGHAFVYNPSADVFQRWSLETFEKETTVKNPVGGAPTRLLMGYSTDGPLYVGGNKVNGAGYAFLHTATFKTVEITVQGGGGPNGTPAITDWYPPVVRVSGDGRVYGWHSVGLSPAGFHSMIITGKSAKCFWEHDTVSPIIPGPDGTLFTGRGVYTPEQKLIGDAKARALGGVIPATAAPWLVNARAANPFPRPGRDKEKPGPALSLGLISEPQLALPVEGLEGHGGDGRSSLSVADRIVFNPTTGVLAVLNETGDKVHLHPVDLKALLDKSDKDYLLVMSTPAAAVPGRKWLYSPDVWSKSGGVTLKVDAGPKGMTATGGALAWDVPKDYSGGEQVIVTVSDKSGQQTFHTFDLPQGTADTALPPADPKVPGTVVPYPGPANPEPPVAVVPRPKANPDQVVVPPAKPFDTPRTKLTAKAAVALPDSADAVCLGGGGRFVLLRLPKVKQVAIVDLCEGKVAKLLPLPEGNALVAAGMSHVFVYSPSADVFQRWSLETFEKEATVKNPGGGSPKKLLMGYSTDGPLCLTAGATFTFLDATTFKKVELATENAGGGFARFDREGAVVRVSGDGRVYGWCDENVSPQGFNSLVIDGKTAKAYHQHMTPWVVVPGPDGKLFTGQGIHTPEQKPIGGKAFADTYPNPVRVPATADPWYVRITYGGQSVPGKSDSSKEEFAVGLVDDADFALPLSDYAGFAFPAQAPHPAHIGRGVPFHDADRVVFNPRAGVLAIIGNADNKVHLHPLDPKALLAKSNRDYLMVMSKPAAAEAGKKWVYTPEVWSKSGKAVLKVESGPAGMKAMGGSVSWDVPKGFAEGSASVILTVSDGGKQETFHTFDLPITGGK